MGNLPTTPLNRLLRGKLNNLLAQSESTGSDLLVSRFWQPCAVDPKGVHLLFLGPLGKSRRGREVFLWMDKKGCESPN